MIGILDYGMGNLRSVEKAIQHLGGQCVIQDHLSGIEKLLIPGVGAFPAAMERLGPMREEIREFARSGQPLMGICLGQQLLFEVGEEGRECEGLGLLPGRVRELPKDRGLKVPHMGWTPLQIAQGDGLLLGIEEGSQVYFVHSFYTDCQPEHAASWTEYGLSFASSIQSGNVWGAQFHPEKSGEIGLRILRNFVEW